MKKFGFITVILTAFTLLSLSQEDTLQKNRIYRTWISLQNNPDSIVRGALYEIRDTSVILSNSLIRKNLNAGRFDKTIVNFRDIDIIKTRNKNSILNGTIIGVLAGFVAGGIWGLIEGDDPPCDYICIFQFTAAEKALMYGSSLALVGGNIGFFGSLVKIQIPINGNLGKFNQSKSRLKKYSYNKRL
jgi:hypothetical protein